MIPLPNLPPSVSQSLPGMLLLRALAWAPSFSGRATRREMIGTILAAFFGSVAAGAWLAPDDGPLAGVDILALAILFGLPILSVMLRRLHDAGRNGLAALVILWPYIGFLIFGVYLLLDGQPHENEFGPDPRGRAPE